jgi:hypothetical protein
MALSTTSQQPVGSCQQQACSRSSQVQTQQLQHGLSAMLVRRVLQRWQLTAADVVLAKARARPVRSLLW